MKHKEYFKDFDDFDYESQQILLSAYNSVLTPDTFHQNKLQSKVISQKNNNAIESSSDNIDWETHEFINLDLLIGKIKLSNSGFWNYQFTYNPKELKSIAPNKSINNGKGGQIPLKVYRNAKIGNVGVKWEQATISQTINVQKEKIYYRLHFYYKDSNESAFILETEYYKEFRDLNILLNYGDVDEYKADYDYFLKNFADTLRNESDATRLKFIYKNIPESILSNLSTHIDNETFFNHLEILSADDDSNIFKDSSTAVIQIFKTFDNPIPILNYYRQNPDRLNRLYYNLDRNSEYDGKIISNKMVLANIMMVLSMRAQNENRKKTAKTFTIGKGYKINSDILEFGVLQGGNKKYADTFFLQQQKDELQRAKIIPKEGDPDAMETVTVDMDQGGEFHPLDMVYLKDLNEEKEVMYLVPAIYLKALADAEEWEVVMQNIRIAADLVAIVIGVLMLPTGNPYFLLLAIADIALAGLDLTIQVFKEEILKCEGGAKFLETWEKIYTVGGFAIAGLTVVGGFYIGAAKLLTKLADGSAKNYLKSLVIKAILETNISDFQKNTLKVLEPQDIFSGVEYKALGNTMAENGVIFLSGQKEGKFAEDYVAMYRGEVIEEFTKTEFSKFYKKWGKLKGEELEETFEEAAAMAKSAKADEKLGGKILKASQIRKYRGELKQRGTKLILEEDILLSKFGTIANKEIVRNYKPVLLGGIRFDNVNDLFYYLRNEGFAGLFDHQNKQIILRANASEYLLFHEMAHLKHFEEIGDAYLPLKPWQRETYVFEEIWKQKHLWTKKEAQHALDYVNQVRSEYGQPLVIKKL